MMMVMMMMRMMMATVWRVSAQCLAELAEARGRSRSKRQPEGFFKAEQRGRGESERAPHMKAHDDDDDDMIMMMMMMTSSGLVCRVSARSRRERAGPRDL